MYLNSSSTSSSDSDEEFAFELVANLPRPRTFQDHFNPLENYDDLDIKTRFR